MRVTAIDSLQRGIANLFANWQLVLVSLAQSLAVTVLIIAGAVPAVLVIGMGSLAAIFEAGSTRSGPPVEALDQLAATAAESIGQLALAAMVAAVVWTVAILVMAYFQGGIFGVLAAGDRQAPASASGTTVFRVFSFKLFKSAADQLTWRFFWLMNLFMVLATLPLLLLVAALLGGAWLVMSESVGPAVALGCVALLVVVVCSFALSVWWQLAMAAAAAGPMGVWSATRHSFAVLVRRLGGVLVLVLLAFVAAIAMAVVFVPFGIVLETVVRDSLWGYIAAQIVSVVVQSLFNGALTVAFGGAMIALVRGELRPQGTLTV